jgi:hypothetical protein
MECHESPIPTAKGVLCGAPISSSGYCTAGTLLFSKAFYTLTRERTSSPVIVPWDPSKLVMEDGDVGKSRTRDRRSGLVLEDDPESYWDAGGICPIRPKESGGGSLDQGEGFKTW